MRKTLKELLLEKYEIGITRSHFTQIKKHVTSWELRDTHPEAINTPMLGLTKVHFLTKDTMALFDIFNIEKSSFEKVAWSADVVDTDRRVTSDAYNILTIWLIYLTEHSSLSRVQKSEMQYNLLKLMHYRFFTSTVNFGLKYGASEDVMEYTINDLSNKFDIKKKDTSTWKLVIEARCKDVLSRSSIHAKTLRSFSTDDKVLYVITDVQTRIRVKLTTIIRKYFKNKEEGNRMGTYGIVGEIEGEKVIKNIVASYDQMISAISNDVLNTNKFIDHSSIDIAVKVTGNVRADMFRSLLIRFSSMAVEQHRKKEHDRIDGVDEHRILTGYRVLISSVIQKTYRECIFDKDVNMKSKLEILQKARNLYRSSRITNEDILVIKNTVAKFVEEYSNSNRESTNASLRICFLSYIILLSFKAI